MDFIVLTCLLLPVFALILVANVLVVRGSHREQLVFDAFLIIGNFLVLLVGLLFLLIPTADIAEGLEDIGLLVDNLKGIALIILLMAGWGILASIEPVRRLLGKVLPLDPTSSVHTLALVMAGYLAGQGALALDQDGLTGLVESSQPVSIALIIGTGVLLAMLAFIGVGFLIRRRGGMLIQRLGITRPKLSHLAAAAAIIVGLVILQAVAGAVWALLNPAQAELLENVNEFLLSDFDTIWEWLLLALASGIGEELLFRGAIQPVFGLGLTSVLFALLHVQYGYTPFMIVILILALILGLVRRYFSTTISIIVHVGYNFVLGIIALLATYLQQYAG